MRITHSAPDAQIYRSGIGEGWMPSLQRSERHSGRNFHPE